MLETHETSRATRPVASFGTGSSYATTRRRAGGPTLRQDAAEDFAAPEYRPEEDLGPRPERVRQRRKNTRTGLRNQALRSTRGRVFLALTLVVLLGAASLGVWKVKAAVLGDRRFAIASSESIQIAGNSHLSRAQLLSVFGDDVDRNILTISLSERRAELERLPWVEHATVMRLLPDHIRVEIVERVPVAFYRADDKIGLVDANGVLLDMPDAYDGSPAPHYSFPVVTGIGAGEPLSTRAARMKIFQAFTSALNGADLNAPKGDRVSDRLSEVDLSSPEDVKALLPTAIGDILVHFGDQDYLARYRRFEQNLPKWQTDYPKLASADMRYPGQVVLEMQPGAAVPVTGTAPAATTAPQTPPGPANPTPKPALKPKPAPKSVRKAAPAKAPAKPLKASAKTPPAQFAPPAQTHLQNSFDIPAGPRHLARKPAPKAVPQ